MSIFPHADRPIASIAFHAQGELLAVASGHKVRNFSWKLEMRNCIMLLTDDHKNYVLALHVALQ